MASQGFVQKHAQT